MLLRDDTRHVLRLQTITLVWMSVEAAVALTAAYRARSLALAAFGGDSVIEWASAAIVFGRFRHDTVIPERVAARLAGGLLLLLGAFVVCAGVASLLGWHDAKPSPLGIVLLLVAAVAMPWLAREKRRLAATTGSAALRADASESALCGYLAWIALAGLIVNAWWNVPAADSVAALLLVPIVCREGWLAIRNEKVCCECD